MPRNWHPDGESRKLMMNFSDILDYDPRTGAFTWRPRPVSEFPDEKSGRVWNSRYSGKAAGTKNAAGYVKIRLGPKSLYAHRLAFFMMTGRWPSLIDHINGDRSDNRWENLREATPLQNQFNRKANSASTTGLKGVCFHKKNNTYQARIVIDGKIKSLGYFKSKEMAAAAYQREAKVLHGEFYRPC